MTYLLVSVFALSIMLLLMPLLQRLALHIGAVDKPGDRKVHQVPIPRIGGVLITFAILLSLVVFAPLARELRPLMAGMLIIAALGLTDDLIGVKAVAKFGLQWLVAAVFLAMARPHFAGLLPLPDWLLLPAAAFFMVALINAVNLQDGLDGLAGGQVVISAVCMAVHLLYGGQWFLVIVLAATISAVTGFLRVNTWPASIFMGDAGSYVLGFLLAAVFLLGLAAGALPWWSAGLYFTLPLLDTAQVIVGRALAGQPIFRADRRHLHHRLLALGIEHQQVVHLEYLLAGILGLTPLLLESPLRLRWAGILLMALLLAVTAFHSLRRPSLAAPAVAPTFLRLMPWAWGLAFLALLGIETWELRGLSLKYGVLPILLALAFAAWSWLRLKLQGESRLSITMMMLVGTQLFVYRMHSVSGFPSSWGLSQAHLLAWVLLGLLSVLLLLLTLDKFELVGSPLEVLILIGTIALLFLPVELKGRFRTDVLALELLGFQACYRVLQRALPPALLQRAPLAGACALLALLAVGILRR